MNRDRTIVIAVLLVLAATAARAEIPADRRRQIEAALPEKPAMEPRAPRRVLIVRGTRVTLRINGVTMCELVDEDPRRTPEGHLALQTHTGPPMTVRFRKIRIKVD